MSERLWSNSFPAGPVPARPRECWPEPSRTAVRVQKAGELPAAIDAAVASSSGLFLHHVLIDPLLKADMAAFIDKAAMNSG